MCSTGVEHKAALASFIPKLPTSAAAAAATAAAGDGITVNPSLSRGLNYVYVAQIEYNIPAAHYTRLVVVLQIYAYIHLCAYI